MSSLRHLVLLLACLLAACSSGDSPSGDAELAQAIRDDPRLPLVRAKAQQLVARELTAGTAYPAVCFLAGVAARARADRARAARVVVIGDGALGDESSPGQGPARQR